MQRKSDFWVTLSLQQDCLSLNKWRGWNYEMFHCNAKSKPPKCLIFSLGQWSSFYIFHEENCDIRHLYQNVCVSKQIYMFVCHYTIQPQYCVHHICLTWCVHGVWWLWSTSLEPSGQRMELVTGWWVDGLNSNDEYNYVSKCMLYVQWQ